MHGSLDRRMHATLSISFTIYNFLDWQRQVLTQLDDIICAEHSRSLSAPDTTRVLTAIHPPAVQSALVVVEAYAQALSR